MKKLITFGLLIISGVLSLSAQINSKTTQQTGFKENLLAFNFIEDIFFNPDAGFLTNTSSFILSLSQPAGTTPVTKRSNDEGIPVNSHVRNIEQFSTVQFKFAMLMDVDVEALTEPVMYDFIDEWMGTRYRMGGTTKKGIDCSAFTGSLLLAVDLPGILPRRTPATVPSAELFAPGVFLEISATGETTILVREDDATAD